MEHGAHTKPGDSAQRDAIELCDTTEDDFYVVAVALIRDRAPAVGSTCGGPAFSWGGADIVGPGPRAVAARPGAHGPVRIVRWRVGPAGRRPAAARHPWGRGCTRAAARLKRPTLQSERSTKVLSHHDGPHRNPQHPAEDATHVSRRQAHATRGLRSNRHLRHGNSHRLVIRLTVICHHATMVSRLEGARTGV